MNRLFVIGIVTASFAGLASAQDAGNPAGETRYLAFQIFTYGPDPRIPSIGEGKNAIARFPDRATLRDYIQDIKRRIGTVGDRRTRLAVVLGHLSFDHGDAEIQEFIKVAFSLAIETDVAVGFHIDDSMFWARRKDLWSDPNNVEALDWEGTPSTGRRLDWQTGPGAKPDAAPPQMCFNSKVIQREVRQRSALIGKAIKEGVEHFNQLNRPEMFAGVIAGSETMLGQDFKTGRLLGYRALLNRGFTREHPPKDLDLEREKIVQEFIQLWTKGLADAGVSPDKIYSHTTFLSYRVFDRDNNAETYSQHNHFAPPSVAFGPYHKPGFSTYPQPGLFDDIYKELTQHKPVGWASCEGTNLQLGSGPGQSGMTMETYLAKMFNHGATLVNIFSWGIGGEANKNMSFRVVTEGEDALRAYRKFLRGEPLIEAKTEGLTLLERLPPKIHRIQRELPAWVQKTGNADQATKLMQQLKRQLDDKDFEEVEKTADSILKLMGVSMPPGPQGNVPEEMRGKLVHELGSSFLVFRDKIQKELKLTEEQKAKLDQRLRELLPDARLVLRKIEGLRPEEREKEMGTYRLSAHAKLAAVAKECLDERQRVRLRQLEMQREGLFGGGEIWNELQVTDEQRKQFVAEIRQVHRRIGPLLEAAQKGGNPDAIRPKILQLRGELQGKLEALLTETQKKRWKEMRGEPIELGALFDLSSH